MPFGKPWMGKFMFKMCPMCSNQVYSFATTFLKPDTRHMNIWVSFLLQTKITDITLMHVTPPQLIQKLLHTTDWCYLHDKKFPISSSGKETISGFQRSVYKRQKIFNVRAT